MTDIISNSKNCACRRVTFCQTKQAGTLFCWFPTPHSLTKVISYLQECSLEYEMISERPALSVYCQAKEANKVAENLAQLLSSVERRQTQVLFHQGRLQPQLQDFSEIASLQRFVKLNQSDWLINMLAAQKLTSHFQPIVSMQDTSKIYGYESLLRGIDEQGNLVSPGAIFESASESGLLPQVDQAARLSAIEQASLHQLDAHIFINFTPTALYDPVFCLRATVNAINQANISHDRIVFEVVESDHPQDLSHLQNILKFYRDAGFLVALDDIGSGYSSLNLLHQIRPDFLKLDMELIRNVHQDPYKASITEKLLQIAQELGIKTVAEGIECIQELNWLREKGADFAQGYLIARPSAVPVTTIPVRY